MIIRLRFVAVLGAFALLLAGFAAYGQYAHSGPTFTGATDPAHVAASRAMITGLPIPAGMTLDPYGTGCDSAGVACYTSSSVEPEAAFASMTRELVTQGGRVRSHACGGADLVEHGCMAMVDYLGSGITVTGGPTLPRPGNPHTMLRLSVSGVPLFAPTSTSAPYGSWESVDPLPAAWTTAVSCRTPTAAGCAAFQQKLADSPAISATAAEACATVRRVMEGHYYLINARDYPATATDAGGCGFFGHRYRTVGGKDGEILSISVRTKDAGHVAVSVNLVAG